MIFPSVCFPLSPIVVGIIFLSCCLVTIHTLQAQRKIHHQKKKHLSSLSDFAEANLKPLSYVAYSKNPLPETLVVDASHPTCEQITHHLKKKNIHDLGLMDLSLRGDSSTDGVCNAIKVKHSCLLRNKHVTSNHFDIDSFLSVWCAANPTKALEHEETIRECAKIGDFRELRLDNGNENQDRGLKLACWLNSEERRLFYRPFESKISAMDGEGEDGDQKFLHFLPNFLDVVENLENHKDQWIEEYNRVVDEYKSINNNIDSAVEAYPDISLVIISPPKGAGHYYSLFSASCGYDIVLACYPENKYELELKYTTMVDISSRKTLPRVDLTRLAESLNQLEKDFPHKRWVKDSVTDSGPLLRLECPDKHHLTKAERYGHPYERPIETSSIDPQELKKIVISYFKHAYTSNGGVVAKCDWSWAEIHEFNKKIDWSAWKRQ